MAEVSKRDLERCFTYADYCAWPEDERWELIDGVAFDMSPAPSRVHSLISVALEDFLRAFLKGKPCEMHHAPFDVRLPKRDDMRDDEIDTVVQPDIVVVCDEKKLDDKGCRGAPDFVIEIISPSTASRDHITKRNLYERHGVREYWLVSPGDRIVTVYRLGANGTFGRPDMHGDSETVEVGLFPGLAIDLAQVFPALAKVVRESPRGYV